MKAHLRSIRLSPKKTNIVADVVRGKSVKGALDMLKFVQQKPAKFLYKVILSAASNAEQNNNMKKDELKIKEIIVQKGAFLKRFLPSSRGRALPLHKPTTHISVTLEKKN